MGPGKFDENGHHDGGQNGVGGMVGQADGKETEDERLGFFPVPEVLVEELNRDD